MDLSLVVEVGSDGERYAAVVSGDILALVKLPLDLVVLAQVLDDAHLGRLLGLRQTLGVAARDLRQSLGRNDAQVVVVVEKSPIHGPYV